MDHNCPKCSMPMTKTNMVTFRNSHVVLRKEQPTVLGPNESNISPYVFPNCGYVELYADKPERFK